MGNLNNYIIITKIEKIPVKSVKLRRIKDYIQTKFSHINAKFSFVLTLRPKYMRWV